VNEYEYLITDTPSEPVRGKFNTYAFGDLTDIPPHVLMLCCVAEAMMEKLRLKNLEPDAYAVMAILLGWPFKSTRGKFAGATPGTSVASIVCRTLLNINLSKAILPTLTLQSINTLRFRMVNNLGAFVGRTIPEVGWAILAYDVVCIFADGIARYNRIVEPADRINDSTIGSLG
jgi:hypothetical protein